jgi:hypothetical protein
VGRNTEIIVILVAGLVVTPEARGLVRRERNQRTLVHVNVRSVGVGRVGVCMLCTCVSEDGVGGDGQLDECSQLVQEKKRQ